MPEGRADAMSDTDTTTTDTTTAGDTAATADTTATDTTVTATATTDTLGDAGKAALDQERKARRDAEKRAKDVEARLKKFEDDQLSEQEKAVKRAADAEGKVAQAEQRLRTANLIAELARPEHGIVNAKAAAKLIDGVEYDDDGEPTNLDTLLPAFLDENPYLKTTAAVADPKPVGTGANAGAGTQGAKPPDLTADELAYAAKHGMTPERYAQMKGTDAAMTVTLDQYLAGKAAANQ
jgi:hypothetical protein